MSMMPDDWRFACAICTLEFCLGASGKPQGSILRRNEHIADPAHGADRVGMRWSGLDLAAQPRAAEVDGAVEGFHLAMCRRLQQPIPLQRPVGILGEQL